MFARFAEVKGGADLEEEAAAAWPGHPLDRASELPAGEVPSQHGLSSNKTALITSDCDAMRLHENQTALITSGLRALQVRVGWLLFDGDVPADRLLLPPPAAAAPIGSSLPSPAAYLAAPAEPAEPHPGPAPGAAAAPSAEPSPSVAGERPQSTQQIWTAIHQNGPNHLGLCSRAGRALGVGGRRSGPVQSGGGRWFGRGSA